MQLRLRNSTVINSSIAVKNEQYETKESNLNTVFNFIPISTIVLTFIKILTSIEQ